MVAANDSQGCLALADFDVIVSPNTVARLLHQMGYSLRVNHKKISTDHSPDRNNQFLYLGDLRDRFQRRGLPIISVDTKKRELVGDFKNAGARWDLSPRLVNDHDFRSDASALAVPRGVYDTRANCGSVFVGASHDTPAFAADTLAQWWLGEGRHRYPQAHEILLLADGGGSNGWRCHAWKKALQDRICNPFGLTVTVSHYPPGTSKWNPIEHRLFSQITRNWAGQPLTDMETMLNFIRTTKTDAGLSVTAHLFPGDYDTGIKISKAEIRELNLVKHDTLGQWNYSLHPARM